MSKNVRHIQHVKSSVVENGQPKLPTASVIVEGEIAVNYADGFETLSIKTSSGNIATFSSDNYYTEKKLGSGFTGENSANTVTSVIEENEEIVSTALNDLDTKKLDVSAYTPTDLSNYYTKSETSGASEISTALSEKENTLSIDSTAKTASFSAEVGKYYIVNVPNNGSVTVTLPTTNMSSTNVQSIVFLVTLGSGTASIGFTPISFATEGFNDMEASSTYEVNALWNGTNWIMAMTKLEAVV
jgi:hypothetical protein